MNHKNIFFIGLLVCLGSTFVPPSAASHPVSGTNAFGKDVTKSGVLEVLIYDDFENHKAETHHFLQGDDRLRYRLYFQHPPQLISGTRLEVHGNILEGSFVVSSYETFPAQQRGTNSNLGEQRTVVLLVNFQNNPGEPITVSEAESRVFDDSNFDSINSFIKETSYDKAFLTGSASGWYELPGNQLCDLFNLASAAMDAAAGDFNFSEYKRLIIVFPNTNLCTFGGFASIGIVQAFGLSITWIKGPVNLDNGVDTSLGNFCRTELKKIPHIFMPKVGEECEGSIGSSGWKVGVVRLLDVDVCVIGFNGRFSTYNQGDITQIKFRPIKTEREKTHDAALKILNDMGEDDTDCWGLMMNELYDAGMLTIPKSK